MWLKVHVKRIDKHREHDSMMAEHENIVVAFVDAKEAVEN
jgi:hypothetical protein